MCVTSAPAQLSGTSVFLGEVNHPTLGEIRVMVYENSAKNLSPYGPNCMLLHIPGGEPVTQANFIPTESCPRIMRDMRYAISPPLRSLGFSTRSSGAKSVEVFRHGIYTVLLTSDPTLIPAALLQVPENQRPKISPELVSFYAESYPGFSFALCCFDNYEAMKATPIMVWYRTSEPNVFRLPGIDAHTGGIPQRGLVDVDHWIFFSSFQLPEDAGCPVWYEDSLSPQLRAFLPTQVLGMEVTGKLMNGDFVIPAHLVRTGMFGSLSHVRRVMP